MSASRDSTVLLLLPESCDGPDRPPYPVVGSRRSPTTVWLSTAAYSAATRGVASQPPAHSPSVAARGAPVADAPTTETGELSPSPPADGDAGESTLEYGLCGRWSAGWATISHPDPGRSVDA